MHTILRTDEFNDWLQSIKDVATRMRLLGRLKRAQAGNLGDHKLTRDGVFEMRENFGPGWRMYFIKQGSIIIVMLGGGNKSTQSKDIDRAVELAINIKE